jgi:adenosylhomocysteine nucleosidase
MRKEEGRPQKPGADKWPLVIPQKLLYTTTESRRTGRSAYHKMALVCPEIYGENALTIRPTIASDAACPCVVFALRREAMFFRRLRRRRRTFPGAPLPATFHDHGPRTVFLLETGVGAASVQRALSWLLSGPLIDGVPYRPTLVVSAGFSGALTSGYNVGDLIVAEDVCDSDGVCRSVTWPVASVSYSRGRLLTIRNIVGSPKEKRRLGEQSGAVAVDMETAVVADLCAAAGVPFGCLRAISDNADTYLSENLLALLQGGGVRPVRLLAAVLRRPRLIAELIRLGADTRKAAKRLAGGLEELLG